MQIFTGKVVAIEKDKNFLNKLFAEVDTKPDSMFFMVNKMKVKIGDNVEIWKEENQMKYDKIIINEKINK